MPQVSPEGRRLQVRFLIIELFIIHCTVLLIDDSMLSYSSQCGNKEISCKFPLMDCWTDRQTNRQTDDGVDI